MATKKTLALTAQEAREFWRAAFIAALPAIVIEHDGHQLSAEGAAHLAADFADAALLEYGRRNAGNP